MACILFLLESNADAALPWVQRAAASIARMVERSTKPMIHAHCRTCSRDVMHAATARRLDPVSPFAHFVSSISFCILSPLRGRAGRCQARVLELQPDR